MKKEIESAQKYRPVPFHLTFATTGRNPVALEEHTLRAIVRFLGRTSGNHLLLFNVVDDHIHTVHLVPRPHLPHLARRLLLGLRPIASAELHQPFVRPIESRSHMMKLIPYVLRQTDKHHLPYHPALWTGSCFLDLVGARMLPGLSLQLLSVVPRLSMNQLCQMLDSNLAYVTPLPWNDIRKLGMQRITDAGSAALGTDPDMEGNDKNTVLARRTVAQVASLAGFSHSEIAWSMNVNTRSVRRWITKPNDTAVSTLRRRLAIEEIIAPRHPQKRVS